eukprot:XP_016659906.1 PREDICTED: ring canal kelch homolog isoform X5 [Acyrthosiphon pisum]
MDSIKHVTPWTSELKKVLKSNGCKPTFYINSCDTNRFFEDLQCLRKEEVLCDIKLETDDGAIVCAHKVVLVSACPYFRAMFTSSAGGDKYVVNISDIDSNILQLLIDFIYTGKIMVTEQNVMIFECVINWVKHELDFRYDNLPKLMEHVRLSLAPEEYISKNVVDEPLIKNNPKCEDFVNEALDFHFIVKKYRDITMPQTIRNSPRQTGLKFLLAMKDSSGMGKCYTSWYDPATKLLHKTKKMNMECELCGLALIKDHLVFALGYNYFYSRSIEMLDLSLQSLQWKPTANMLVDRNRYGVGVLDDRIYAVGGDIIGDSQLNSAEVFDVSVQKWQLISSHMSTGRINPGVGVLNNLLYAVGGYKYPFSLKSVECYDPSLDTWTLVAQMSTSRRAPGIGVLDGIMYAIGGDCQDDTSSVGLKSVEAYTPIDKVWSTIPDMHLCRVAPKVVTFKGLLYVIGGFDGSTNLDSVEIYNPNKKTWTMEPFPTSVNGIYGSLTLLGRLDTKNNIYTLKS